MPHYCAFHVRSLPAVMRSTRRGLATLTSAFLNLNCSRIKPALRPYNTDMLDLLCPLSYWTPLLDIV